MRSSGAEECARNANIVAHTQDIVNAPNQDAQIGFFKFNGQFVNKTSAASCSSVAAVAVAAVTVVAVAVAMWLP